MAFFDTIIDAVSNIDLGDALELGSAALGIAGEVQGPNVQAMPQSGYETYPDWLKEIYEETYAPAMLEQFNEPFRQQPMQRYTADPDDPFASQAMLGLQEYSDAIGGLFTPYTDYAATPEGPAMQEPAMAEPVTAEVPATTQAAIDEAMLAAAMPGNGQMNTRLYQLGYTPGKIQQLLDAPETYTNPFSGEEFNRAEALREAAKALTGSFEQPISRYGAGAEQLVPGAEQYKALTYDPRTNWVGKVAPYVASAIAAPVLAGGLGAVGLGAGTLTSAAAKQAANQMISKARA